MSSQTSRSTLEDSYSAEREAKKQDSVAALTQNFCPVTLTVNVFFRQVCLSVYYLLQGRSLLIMVCSIGE